ncbi:MAG: hypothetical protein IJY44_02425 [Bacteroidaceae bacterium]|nr:hypothetical protein [Bacteroidaceae bacterium]
MRVESFVILERSENCVPFEDDKTLAMRVMLEWSATKRSISSIVVPQRRTAWVTIASAANIL